jgi:hypothetical protein
LVKEKFFSILFAKYIIYIKNKIYLLFFQFLLLRGLNPQRKLSRGTEYPIVNLSIVGTVGRGTFVHVSEGSTSFQLIRYYYLTNLLAGAHSTRCFAIISIGFTHYSECCAKEQQCDIFHFTSVHFQKGFHVWLLSPEC